MFFPEDRVRVGLYARPTDMRKQFDGLAALARNQLEEDPMSGHLFEFINRRRTYMKVLYFDRGGYCLWCKRLEQGQFNYNVHRGDKQALSWTDPVVVKIDVALPMLRQPVFLAALPSPGSATRFRRVTSSEYLSSSAADAAIAPPDRRRAAWPVSSCPARTVAY